MEIIIKLSLNLALWQYTLHVYEGSQKTEHTFDVPPLWERNLLRNGESLLFINVGGETVEIPREIFELMEKEISGDAMVKSFRQQFMGRAKA